MIIEIKFRGKRIDGKGWVYGSLTQSEIDVNKLNVVCRIHTRFANCDSIEQFEVIPETVGQLSPFKDKNGVGIYEAEIIGDYTDVDGQMVQSKLQVYFDEMLGQWMLDNSENQDKSISYSLFQELNDFEYEVIGNIYDSKK